MRTLHLSLFAFAVSAAATSATAQAAAQGGGPKRALTFPDIMRFETIRSSVISDDGRVVACVVRPDRGDGSVRIHVVGSERRIVIPRGSAPRLGPDGRFAIATVVAPFLAEGKDKPRSALAIADIDKGAFEVIADVEQAELSDDGRFVAWQHFAAKPRPATAEATAKTGATAEPAGSAADQAADPDAGVGREQASPGRGLVLRELATGAVTKIDAVSRFGFSPGSRFLTYAVSQKPRAGGNGIYHRRLADGQVLGRKLPGFVGRFAWSRQGRVAYTHAPIGAHEVLGETGILVEAVGDQSAEPSRVTANALGRGVVLRNDATLEWTKDGRRLLFGVSDRGMEALVTANAKRKTKAATEAARRRLQKDPYSIEAVLAEREVDVWHTQDPLINSNQKKQWSADSKRSYRCVFDVATGSSRRLADANMTDVTVLPGSDTALGRSNKPWQRQITWDGRYQDWFLVDVATGKRRRVLARQSGPVSLSPQGRFLLWYQNGHWWLRDDRNGQRRNLTRGAEVPFADEDHDYPSTAPGYGVAGWFADGSGVLVYDKFDVWRFQTDGSARCLTGGAGRKAGVQLRVVDLDPESDDLDPGAKLLLTGIAEESKGSSVWTCEPDGSGLRRILDTDDRIRVVARAKKADRILYTREDYDRFPDLHVCDLAFAGSRQVTDLDAQRAPFSWGTAELIDWRSIDGRRIQGAVIKPGGYDPKRRYPVLVYYYRFFSQRVNEWNEMAVNHRPNFPFYASNGYVVFLPDIRFDVGQPGFAATKCLVPGVQKLIDLGIADPNAIALHGHSWSGYQTAFVITQTNLFACAIAGAPVSNMTSAYGGIRWSSGLSRQFQYEKAQSRIGGSLWDYPERYIENSPVFFADRIQTPLLIQFGDEDGAVPWYQGIELYMAMRRLDKPCVFLQYRKEPHHLQKYANKLDYSIRFKEYLDHYCKGTPAPKWIRQGEPYQGR